MFGAQWSDRLPSAMLKAAGYWEVQHHPHFRPAGPHEADVHPLTIAFSREEGAGGPQIAREAGAKLHWPVFDHELLERIAEEMNVRVELVESVDEHRQAWLVECLKSLTPHTSVSEPSYLRHLVETLFTLAAHGSCVIVGRGAAQLLPAATTLRVRVVAPLEDRVARVSQDLGITEGEAKRRIAASDRDRIAFVKEHFHKDPTDPLHYDLVLNGACFSPAEAARLIAEAVQVRRDAAGKRAGVKAGAKDQATSISS